MLPMPDVSQTPNLHAMIVVDRAGRVVHANEIAKRFSVAAYGRELSNGDSMYEFSTADSRGDFGRNLATAFEGAPVYVRRVLTYPTGVSICFDVSYEPLSIDGEVRYVVFSAHDMSRDLLDQEKAALFSRALDQTTTGVILCDARSPDTPIVHANAAFARITGYPVAEILGRNCRFLQGDEPHQEGLEIVRETLRKGTACVVTLRNRRKDGTPFLNRLALSTIRDRNGEVTHFLGIQEDVTANAEGAPALEPTSASRVLSAARAGAARPERAVLLVDDDATIRAALARALRRSGFVVHETGSAVEAEALVQRHDFAAVISDVLLADGGPELAAVIAFRKRHPARPVILASGLSRSDLMDLERTHRASVLVKPFTVEELLARLDSLLATD